MAAYQQGVSTLSTGVNEYVIPFSSAFSSVPNLIYTQVFNSDPLYNTPLWIEAVVTARAASSFTVTLTQTPDSDDYIMSWFAGDMSQTVVQPGLPGIGIMELPEHKGDLPLNSYLPMVIPGRTPQTKITKLGAVLRSFSALQSISATQINDASISGRSVLTGNPAQARAILNVPSTNQVQVAMDLAQGAQAFGVSVLNSPSDTTARTLMDVPSNLQVAGAISLAGSVTTLGAYLVSADDEEAIRTRLEVPSISHTHTPASIGAAAISHTHSVLDITGAEFVQSFLQASTPAFAQTHLKAAPEHGWKYGYVTVNANRTISEADLGAKLVVTANSTIVAPGTTLDTTLSGRTAIYVTTGVTALLAAASGVTLMDEVGSVIVSPYTALAGYYELERVSNTTWVIKGSGAREVRALLSSASLSDLKSGLGFVPADITTSEFIKTFLESSTQELARNAVGAASKTQTVESFTSTTLEQLSEHYTLTPAGTLFVVSGGPALELDDLGTMVVGESFELHAKDAELALSLAPTIKLNDGIVDSYYDNYVVPAGSVMKVTLASTSGANKYLIADLRYQKKAANIIWVSPLGSNTTGTPGRQDLPYASLSSAANVANVNDLIVVTPGAYTVTTSLTSPSSWYFMPGATVSSTSTGLVIFTSTSSYRNPTVFGAGEFHVAGTLVRNAHSNGNTYFECHSISTPVSGTSSPIFEIGTPAGSASIKCVVRHHITRTNAPLLRVPSAAVAITGTIGLGSANVQVASVLDGQGPYTIEVEGGHIQLANELVTGEAGATLTSKALFSGQQLIGNQNDLSPANVTTETANVWIRVQDCQKLNTTLSPGPGRIVVRNTNIANNVVLDSGNLMLINCTQTTGTISTLDDADLTLSVGGSLTISGSTAGKRMAKYAGGVWQALDDGLSGPALASAMDDTDLYVGGLFDTAGGVTVNNIARWDGTTWYAVGTGTSGYADGAVYEPQGQVNAVISDGAGNVYIGGNFSAVNGVSAMGVAKWNGTVWAALGYGPGFAVTALALRPGGRVLAGGVVGGELPFLSEYDGSTWTPFATSAEGSYARVNAMAVDASDEHVWWGGVYQVPGVPPFHLGAYILDPVDPPASYGGGLDRVADGPVHSIIFDDSGTMYMAGDFTEVGAESVPARRVARRSSAGVWSAVGSGTAGPVYALASPEPGQLYAAGEFSEAGGTQVYNTARWTGSAWRALSNGTNGPVNTLAIDGTSLYAGGSFTGSTGAPLAHVTAVGGPVIQLESLGTVFNDLV
jgi:hypothetical protein